MVDWLFDKKDKQIAWLNGWLGYVKSQDFLSNEMWLGAAITRYNEYG